MDYMLDLDVLFDENRCCLVHEARRVCNSNFRSVPQCLRSWRFSCWRDFVGHTTAATLQTKHAGINLVKKLNCTLLQFNIVTAIKEFCQIGILDH